MTETPKQATQRIVLTVLHERCSDPDPAMAGAANDLYPIFLLRYSSWSDVDWRGFMRGLLEVFGDLVEASHTASRALRSHMDAHPIPLAEMHADVGGVIGKIDAGERAQRVVGRFTPRQLFGTPGLPAGASDVIGYDGGV